MVLRIRAAKRGLRKTTIPEPRANITNKFSLQMSRQYKKDRDNCISMTSFAHQKNLCKWGWGGSEIRLAIINCKRRTDFAPTERPRCCGWIFSNYFFGTFRRPNCMARVTQNLKADTNTSLSLANWALSLYFDKPIDHFTHPWWEFFSWAKLVMHKYSIFNVVGDIRRKPF